MLTELEEVSYLLDTKGYEFIELPKQVMHAITLLSNQIETELYKTGTYNFTSSEELTVVFNTPYLYDCLSRLLPEIFKAKGTKTTRNRTSIIGYENCIGETVDTYSFLGYSYVEYEKTTEKTGFYDGLSNFRFGKKQYPEESLYKEQYPLDAKMQLIFDYVNIKGQLYI